MNTQRKETLSRRERVRRAIEHKPVDRMPIDLGCHYSTGISAFAYFNLRKYLGFSTDNVEIVDPGQFLARVDGDVLDVGEGARIALYSNHYQHGFEPTDDDVRNLAALPESATLYIVRGHRCVRWRGSK